MWQSQNTRFKNMRPGGQGLCFVRFKLQRSSGFSPTMQNPSLILLLFDKAKFDSIYLEFLYIPSGKKITFF